MSVFEQARALLGLRMLLFWRRIVRERQWARVVLTIAAAILGAAFSASLCALILTATASLRSPPHALFARGGPLAIFLAAFSLLAGGRIWLGLVAVAQTQTLIDPRRFRLFPVAPALISAINALALYFDPVWVVLYPPATALALGISRLPGAPPFAALLGFEVCAVCFTVGVLHLGSALAAVFDARPMWRRLFSVALLLAGFIGFQLSVVPRHAAVPLLSSPLWRSLASRPLGWLALALFALGALCSLAAHLVSEREAVRPPEAAQGPARAPGNGWALPLLGPAFSALFEKEAKTVARVGWLQLVAVPAAYLLLMRSIFAGPQPLLIAAVYAHLGVLEIATNAFGRDVGAARAYFLWPVSLRQMFAAKNAVAYCFSLAIFLLLAGVATLSAKVTLAQVAVGLVAHAAIFPLLAAFGNAVSVLYPVPVRGARLRRVRGAGPIASRLLALALLAAAAWAPYAIAQISGLALAAAYLGQLLAMATAYAGLLSFSAHLLESRREPLLAALLRGE